MHPSTIYLLFFTLFDAGMSLTFVGYVPFLLSLGLSLSNVSMINVWFMAAILAGEVPTGIFADRVSRGRAVQFGIALHVIGSALYATATGFKTALAYEMILGFGASWISGAGGAWIRDALTRTGEEQRYARLIGTSAIIRAITILIFGALGSLIATRYGFRVIWICSAVIMLAAFVISLIGMTDIGNPILHPDARPSDRCQLFSQSVRALRTIPGLGWITAACMIYGLVLPFNHYWTPFFLPRVGTDGMPLLWIVMYGSLAASGFVIRRMVFDRSREILAIIVAMLITAVGFFLLSLPQAVWMSWVLVGVHEIGRGLFSPLIEIFTQHRVESAYRATYSSLQSLLTKIGYVLTLTAVWWSTRGLPANDETIQMVWKASGGLLLILIGVLWTFRPQRSCTPRA